MSTTVGDLQLYLEWIFTLSPRTPKTSDVAANFTSAVRRETNRSAIPSGGYVSVTVKASEQGSVRIPYSFAAIASWDIG
jgi:hypothetical protein